MYRNKKTERICNHNYEAIPQKMISPQSEMETGKKKYMKAIVVDYFLIYFRLCIKSYTELFLKVYLTVRGKTFSDFFYKLYL